MTDLFNHLKRIHQELICISILLFIAGCQNRESEKMQAHNLLDQKQKMIQSDVDMSNLATKVGFNNSLLIYADSNFVKLSEGIYPIIGKKAFEASFNKDRDVKTISWSPVDGALAQSGELGYTWGNWKFVTTDTIYYGNYFTVWKKQSDGSWMVLLDGGNSTPAPKNED